VDKVSAWPHPVRDIKWKAEMRDAVSAGASPRYAICPGGTVAFSSPNRRFANLGV